jgi:hypothetical protein
MGPTPPFTMPEELKVLQSVQEETIAPVQAPMLTINARGKITGDVSNIPAETLENLQSPEGQEQMRSMYRKQFGSSRRVIAQATHREPSHEPRDFRHLCPPGMSSREFRKLRRKFMHDQTKAVLKEKRNASN